MRKHDGATLGKPYWADVQNEVEKKKFHTATLLSLDLLIKSEFLLQYTLPGCHPTHSKPMVPTLRSTELLQGGTGIAQLLLITLTMSVAVSHGSMTVSHKGVLSTGDKDGISPSLFKNLVFVLPAVRVSV